jgi:hypothetical protein
MKLILGAGVILKWKGGRDICSWINCEEEMLGDVNLEVLK